MKGCQYLYVVASDNTPLTSTHWKADALAARDSWARNGRQNLQIFRAKRKSLQGMMFCFDLRTLKASGVLEVVE